MARFEIAGERKVRAKAKWRGLVGKQRLYSRAFEGREDVVLWDVFPVSDGEILRLVFEGRKSDAEQGVWLMTDSGLTVGGKSGKDIDLWFGDVPGKEALITCRTKDGLLSVYNTWDTGRGRRSQGYTSGMLVEDLPNGRRYRCHDFGLEPEFDRLVFRLERVSAKVPNPLS